MEVFKRRPYKHLSGLEAAWLRCVSTPQARTVPTKTVLRCWLPYLVAAGVERAALPSQSPSSRPSSHVRWVRRMTLTDPPRPTGSCICELSPRACPSQHPHARLLIGALRAAAQVPTAHARVRADGVEWAWFGARAASSRGSPRGEPRIVVIGRGDGFRVRVCRCPSMIGAVGTAAAALGCMAARSALPTGRCEAGCSGGPRLCACSVRCRGWLRDGCMHVWIGRQA